MWNIPRVLLVASAAFVLLAGCVQRDAIVTPAPVPSATPMFANEQEALAAAEKAYAVYNDVSDKILQAGGANPERIDTVVSKGQVSDELVGYQLFSSKRLFTRGDSMITHFQLERYLEDGINPLDLVVYLCSDVSQVRIFDSEGADVTPSDRPTKQALEVSFAQSSKRSGHLVVAGSEAWSGSGICS